MALIASFYDNVDTSEDRRNASVSAATNLCREDEQLGDSISSLQLAHGASMTGTMGRRLDYATQIVREQFTSDVPRTEGFRSITGKAAKYTPLVGSYNRMADAACTVRNESEEGNISDRALRRYYVSTLVFGVDALLLTEGAFYKPAFAGTRYVTNRASEVGLYRLRYVLGDRAWALGMSEIHATLRGSMLGLVDQTMMTAGEMGLKLSAHDVDWTYIAEAQGVEQTRLLSNTTETIPSHVSWNFASAGANRTMNVTIGNATREVAIPKNTSVDDAINQSEQITGMRVTNVSLANTGARSAVNQTLNATELVQNSSVYRDGTTRVANATRDARDATNETLSRLNDADKNVSSCVSEHANDSTYSGFWGKAKSAVDSATHCAESAGNSTDPSGWLMVSAPRPLAPV
ncbi:hypothetical protein GCM10009037_01220 [Halarchaeum grantii]|uniref:Uncharacterized protein n=2 Tax=Halarchaeum grantii TaxID=1193105 RepID=A0A830F5I9_9EURY|nr:hypothetical protein GCM10009037_01220 [Halarchaeum grantii]